MMLFPIILHAQNNAALLQRITQPAPEAASITKYGIYPVSMFTGIPDISIPIYNIDVGNYSLPLNISYHGSGIKVNDLASCVGLGWTMNAGGVITRTVMGVPDEDPARGIFRLGIKRESQITEADYDRFLDLMDGEADTEPDVFSFSFGDKTGKFIIGADKKVRMLPYNNLRVRYENGLFEITDDDGTVYKFLKTSYSVNFSDVASPKFYPTTSWYLTTILLNNKVDSITFTYSGYTPGRMETIDNYITLGMYPQNGPLVCDAVSCHYPLEYRSIAQIQTSMSYQDYSLWYVNSITFPTGKINFTLNTTRQDYGHVLDKITVTNNNNKVIKQIALSHAYFFNDQGYNVYARPQDKYRLKLTEMNETGTTGTTPLKHRFEYEEQYQLPPRHNFGIDYWGYYNGNYNNQHLMTLDDNGLHYTHVWNGMSNATNFAPVNRNTNEDYMKAGMLKRVYYPTGGYTDFEFEANRVSVEKVIDKPGGYIFVAAKKDDLPSDSARVSRFISPVTVSATASTPATLTLNLPLWSDIKKPEIIFQNLTKGTFERYRTYPGEATFRTVNIALNQGDLYRVATSIFPNPNDPNDDTDEDVLATVRWPSGQHQTITVVQKGPGLRIKSIKGYTVKDSLARWEEYKYGEGESGMGKVSFFDYLFARKTYVQDYTYCLETATEWITSPHPVTRLEILSKPIFTYSDFGGSNIFYTEVTKYDMGRFGDNGKIVYNYDYEMDDKIESTYPDPQLLISAGWKSGNLLSERKYKRNLNGTYQLLTESKNTYTLYSKDTAYGLSVGKKVVYVGAGTCRPTQGNVHTAFELSRDFRYFEYPLISGTKRVTTTVNKVFTDNSDSLVASISYTYNPSNYLVTTTASQNSKGEAVKEVSRYPSDKASMSGLTAEESATIDTMLARNMIGALIERENYISNISTAKAHFEFAVWGTAKKLVALKKMKVKLGSGAMQDMYQMYAYDDHGNVLERADNGNDAHEVYLWGYNYSYPVAKLINTTYNSAAGLVSNTILQSPASPEALEAELSKLRNVQLLPDVDVNTLTYEPLLGAISMKDPSGKIIYYEYDSFGRLVTVRDAAKNIVKQYDYQYQQPLTQ